ncbi:helix-turn-helix domain-containing protein [Christiangramia crocea]|uniref:Helix-turn-helix domain-containing protein n=1 Tax=Christiangramia crocea TaxID=2904124 RepID=A0A9X1UYQ9_9FLAO|nr:helix-turn-helix domain-containing protein [Gramella crocea]MCG9972792.1 helix-turn-helix domain-containing protein [Gramella crocea]
MAGAFVDRVKKSILRNIDNEKFGVSDLAKELNLSRSQLLRKLKAATGKPVNQFIREIRLEESVKLLLSEDLTASEISYKVGFNSPSYFNKCFLNHYGVTPGEFKKSNVDLQTLQNKDPEPVNKKRPKKTIIFTFLIIAVFLTGLMAVIFGNKPVNNNPRSSIAVLPLLDLSKDQDKEYLVDGLTEAITLELSKINSIRVISRGSAMKYKGKSNLYSKIAKDLNVDLLLEGSVLYSDDSLRVVVQLIEPLPKEKHLWQNSYDRNHSDIIGLVHNVSNEIAKEISAVIDPIEPLTAYKPDAVAYDLYLKGKHILNTQRTREFSLQKAIEYLNSSIDQDSLFAPAYVALAETYLAFNNLIGDNQIKLNNRKRAKTAVDKALLIDATLAEAYITKGSLLGKLDWNWDKMKTFAEKGLKLDPNNSKARILLSDYHLIKGNYAKAIEEALIAEKLDPINPNLGCFVAERYYINHEYEKSIAKYNQVIELNPNYGGAYDGLGYAFFKIKQPNKTVESWQKLQHIMGNTSLADCYDKNDFQECLRYYLSEAKKDTPRFCRNPGVISSIHMMVNEEQEALEYLRIAYQYRTEDLPVKLTYPDFHPLHDYLEFQEIAKNIGVTLTD